MTPKDIAEIAEQHSTTILGNIRAINRLFREMAGDCEQETEQAIRRIRRLAHYNGAYAGIEYCYMLDNEISDLVNKRYQ
jgi:hypothetical protein